MIFYFLHNLFAVFAVLIALFPFLFSFAKGLEDVVMIREVKGKDLREGDWLASDVKFRGKTIKSSFEGVNSEEIEFLKKKGKVKIKDGIPFVPAFLIGYILYYFYADYALGLLLLLF